MTLKEEQEYKNKEEILFKNYFIRTLVSRVDHVVMKEAYINEYTVSVI